MSTPRTWPAAATVLLAGVATALHIGKLPPAVPILQAELGVTLVQAAFLLSLVQGAGMLLGIAVGTATESVGLRRSVIAGLVIVTAASVAGGYVRSVALLLLLRALEGLGVLLATVPAPALLRRIVAPDRVRVVLGMWSAYVPFGNGVALFAGPLLMARLDWPWWWWVLAIGTAICALAVWRVVPADPPRPVVTSVGGESWNHRIRDTLSDRGPWLAALVFGLYASQWMAIIGFLPTVYAAAGWTGVSGAALTGLVPFVNVFGNLAAGALLHRHTRPLILIVLGLAGQFVGAFLAFSSVTAGSPVAQYVGALIFSAVGGLVPGTLFALAPETAPTPTTVSTTVGWVQQISAFGQVFGPPLLAALVGVLGGWQMAWTITLVTSVLGAVLGLVLQRHWDRRHRQIA